MDRVPPHFHSDEKDSVGKKDKHLIQYDKNERIPANSQKKFGAFVFFLEKMPLKKDWKRLLSVVRSTRIPTVVRSARVRSICVPLTRYI